MSPLIRLLRWLSEALDDLAVALCSRREHRQQRAVEAGRPVRLECPCGVVSARDEQERRP